MKTFTIKEALLDESSFSTGFVYVVRDGEVVLYVGSSQHPTFRLCQHVGIADAWRCNYSPKKLVALMETGVQDGSWMLGCSDVGRCIREHTPNSLTWSFDVYESQDAIELLKQAGTVGPHILLRMEEVWYAQRTLVEKALIDKLNPCFNFILNHHPTPIPERYQLKVDLDNNAVDYLNF